MDENPFIIIGLAVGMILCFSGIAYLLSIFLEALT